MGSNRRWCLVILRQSFQTLSLAVLLSSTLMGCESPSCRAGAHTRAREGALV